MKEKLTELIGKSVEVIYQNTIISRFCMFGNLQSTDDMFFVSREENSVYFFNSAVIKMKTNGKHTIIYIK